MTSDISCRILTHIRLQMPRWRTNGGRETLYLAVTQPFINMETSSFHLIVRNDTGHQLWKINTYPFTNSKMADKMAAVKHYNWL